MEIIVTNPDVTFERTTGATRLSFRLQQKDEAAAIRLCDELSDKEIQIEAKRYRPKKSRNANKYAWTLLNKIGEALNMDAREVYKDNIRNIGGNMEIVRVRADAAEKFAEIWQARGIGWPCEIIDYSEDDETVEMAAYYGSSTYDTAQMSRLINNIVQDCKTLGIETMPPAELAALLESWEKQKNAKQNTQGEHLL